METRYFKDLDRVDGEPMEFESKNFPGFTTLGILDEIQKIMAESKCEPEHFKGRIIFMSVYNDIDRTKRGNKENCNSNAHRNTEYARRFTQGHWSFLGPGSEKKWYGTHAHKPDREWEMTAEGMMLNFAESGHPVFRATSALERELRSKDKGKKSIHVNGSEETIELILRTVPSVNHLSFHGAVAELCKELARDSPSAGKPAANEILGSMVIPTEFLIANTISQTDADVQGNLLREYEQKFAEHPEQQQLTKVCSNAGFSKILAEDNSSLHLMKKDLNTSCREYTFLEVKKHPT